MNSNLTKKFLKKNLLLQQNLEKFLTWRENKKNYAYPIKFSKKFLPFVKPRVYIDSSLDKKIFGYKQISKKLYRPIESKPSRSFLKQEYLSDFFPHKKPFMHFWIFPLLGCCFLSAMTLNKKTTSINKFNNFSTLQFPLSNVNNFYYEYIKKGPILSTMLKNLVLTTKNTEVSFNKSFLKRSKQNLLDSTDPSHKNGSIYPGDTYFSASYGADIKKSSQTQILSKKSLPIEFENLCVFYLNLTNQNLTSSFKNYSFNPSTKQSAFFLENAFHKNFTLKGPATLNWTWHSLKIDQKNLFSIALDQSDNNKLVNSHVDNIEKNKLLQSFNIENFPQKINKNNFISENWNSYSFYLANLKSKSKLKLNRVPHISYYQAAELLDEWIKGLELNYFNRPSYITENKKLSNFNLFLKLLKSDLKNTEKGSLIYLFERIYLLENSLLTSLKKTNNLAFNFAMLLDKITENQKNLKNIFSQVNATMDQMQSTEMSSKSFTFVPKMQSSEPISYKNRIEKIINKYRYDLIKIWLDNYFSKIYSQTLYSNTKSIFSTQTVTSLNTHYNNLELKNSGSNDSYNQEKSLKFQTLKKDQRSLFIKDSKIRSSLIKNKFHILKTELKLNDGLDKKLKKVLNFTVFLKLSKQKFLLKNETENLLAKIQSVHRLKFALKNSILLNKEAMLIDSTKLETPLSLLNYEKNVLPISLKTLDLKLKHLAYELMLLQYWKKIFPETFSLQNSTGHLDSVNEKNEKSNFKTNFLVQNTLSNNTNQLQNLSKSNSVYNSSSLENNIAKEFVCLTNKLVKEINLYRQFKNISQKLVEFPLSTVTSDAQKFLLNKTSKLAIEKNITNKILTYKTPILFSDIPKLQGFSSENENKLMLTNKTIQFFKTDWKLHPKYWTQTPLSLIDLASKQTHLASSIIPYKQNNSFVFNLEKKVSFIKKDSSKMNFLQYLFDKITKKEFLFKNSKSDRDFNFYLNKNKFHLQKVKKFSITKKFSDLKNQKIYLLKPFSVYHSNQTKNSLKIYKLKSIFKSKPYTSVFEKRKAEKIFRTYLSLKSLENPETSSSLLNTSSPSKPAKTRQVGYKKRSFQSVLPILRKLRKMVKTKKTSYKKYTNKISLHLLENPTLKDTELFPKKKSSANFIQKPFRTSNKYDLFKYSKNVYFRSFNKNSIIYNRFQSKTFLKKLGGALNFLKKSNFSITDTEKRRLEKKKALQKKRRLKKLKLENRRRKKRKRFYPRPHYLRFQLYYSFLQKRHPQTTLYPNVPLNNEASPVLTKKFIPLLSNTKDLTQSDSLNTDSNTIVFKEKIYRKKRQKWGNISSNLFSSEKFSLKKLSFGLTNPTYHQQEFYKISNETLTEFERLCWKSYWLRSNLTPYIRRIQTNLKTMQQKESLKQSKITFLDILKNLVPWSAAQCSKLSLNVNNSNINIKKQMKSFTPAYLNVKETLDNSFFKESAFTFFKKLENKAEYDRLIYERITDEIKNVKSQLNVDGQNHARSYKPGRKKIEKPISKNFLNSFNTFYNNFMEPNIQPFSVFSVINDFSIKPFGDLPTLRLLWACNKTNLFTYTENNFSRTLWSNYKIREQTKTNKTKKFMSKLFKTYSFIPRNIDLISSTKTKLACKKIQLFGGGAVIYGKNYNSYLRKLKYNLQISRIDKSQLLRKEKSLVDSNASLASKHSEFLNNLDLKNSQKKNQSELSTHMLTQVPKGEVPVAFSTGSHFDKKTWFETNLTQKSQKRMVHFWWSTKQINPMEQILSFWMMSPLVFPSLDFYINENTNSIIQQKDILKNENFTNLNEIVSFSKNNTSMEMNFNKTVIITSFWICCLLLHISILFTVIRIPEIRSLAKFQFLILSKLANTYLICLFSLYDLFKDYKTKISILIRKSLKFSIKDSSSSSRFSTFIPSVKFLLDDQSSQINWNNQMKFQNNYTQQLLTNEKYRKIGNLKNLKTRFNKVTGKGLKNRVNFAEQKVKQKQKTLIQSTMVFELNFREFLHVSKPNEQNQSKTKQIDSIQKNLNFIIYASINPFFGKIDTSAKINMDTNRFTNNWFYSWYTGFLWYTFSKPLKHSTISENKRTYLKQNLTKFFSVAESKTKFDTNTNSYSKKNLKTIKATFSSIVLSNIQVQSILSLVTLSVTKMSVNVFYFCFNLFYKLLFKLIDIMESILLIFYKFLEKPAELMVEWIAEIFLIEWSSDLTTYVPEAFDTTVWNSATKMSRSTRPLGGFLFGFLIQRTFLNSIEIFYNMALKPDTDLIVRQKKGIIFWDIWTEILIQAAETYKMNLSSLSTIKEEQELLIENLLEDKGILMQKNKIEFSKVGEKSTLNNTNFLNSNLFKASLSKMNPLMKFLQIYPQNPTLNPRELSNIKNSKIINNLFYPRQFFVSKTILYNLSSFKIENQSSSNTLEINMAFNSYKKWAVSQYLTTQGRDTDLFMDIHPPKSFLHISFLKTYLPAQEILGSLVCDIYSGLFAQKISKNVLVVGAPGSAKSFFIQALAGETELKIVTDNAHRYAIVQGGVPIGMKLLRDVFDSIALHTPCLFLLEDIHVIGERRPMLISDDENSKATDSAFGAEQEEVHEKNRLIYQLSRHALSHYKRPYRGDFSLSIPTNHFCYDLFLGISPPRKRRSELTAKSPLPIVQLEKALEGKDQSNPNKEDSKHFNENKNFSLKQTLLSSLQISTEQIFAPPATSPFTILLMKEQKKLKPKKFVKELPWSGLSYDQFMLISKSHYSVRVKVSLLAEMAMTNLSIKLDMITDLLVIIDSVRSNRGFVVFATTHAPSLLDPALRRPGRLDETISLPLLPNLISRFEIFKTNLSSYSELTDLVDYSLLTSKAKLNENQIYTYISKSLLLLLNAKKGYKPSQSNEFLMSQVFPNFFNDYPIYSFSQAFQTSINLNSSLIHISQLKNCLTLSLKTKKLTESKIPKIYSNQNLTSLLKKQTSKIVFSGNDKLNYISLTYSQAGQFLVESLIIHDQTTYSSKFPTDGNELQEISNTEEQIFKTLYNSKIEYNHTLFKLFAGRISQFFVLNNSPKFIKSNSLSVSPDNNNYSIDSKNFDSRNYPNTFSDNLSLKKKEYISMKKNWWLTNSASLQTNPSQSSISENIQNFQTYWQSATSFLDSFFQKRYLYNKNSIVSKMLLFEDTASLREPPSPPNSSILMPAKKFENYKRTLRDFIKKPMLTINEKIQIHQKQRFLKLLYNVPIQRSFATVSNQKNITNSFNSSQNYKYTNFYNSFKELGYLDLLTLKPTSSYCFYKNRFLKRQRFSFLNQWWNGQLAEHNVETTYLSHVDWRSMFVQSLGDLVIDFPDADQYYNPRSRRWFLHSDSWAYWLSFEKNLTHEISQHYILNCFTKTSNLLNENRELFDYLAFRFLRYHQLKEIDFLHSLIRFYKNKKC